MLKKLSIIASAFIILTTIILFTFFSIADIVRFALNINLENYNVKLNFPEAPQGLHKNPFSIDFSDFIFKYSYRKINITAINTFTVGNLAKDDNSNLDEISNFLDPTSKFKDTWFGIYIILDDPKSRKFMLRNPELPPSDFYNYNTNLILKLPEIDQKLIFSSSLQGMKPYHKLEYKKNFYFVETENINQKVEIVKDKSDREWLRITSKFRTLSALTDIKKTNMKTLYSIRSYVGLPDKRVYELVDPWHQTMLIGAINVRYFECTENNFWALIYYNGTNFKNKQGVTVNTWKDTDLKKLLEEMFYSLEIDCLQ